MTMTDELAAVHAARRRSPVARSTRTMTRFLVHQAWWYLGIVLVLALGTYAVMLAIDEPTVSVVQFGRQSATWYPFAIAVLLASAHLPAHVAVGMTRASFVRGALLAALVMGAFYTAVFTGAMALEGVVYDAAGWQHRITDTSWFTRDPGDLGAVAAGMFAGVVVAHGSGYLVGVVYQRVGGWWGTLLLPLTAGPVLGVMALLSGWIDDDRLGVPLRWALVALVAAALAVAFAAVARRFALRTTGG